MLILNLRLHRHGCCATGNIKLSRVNVNTGCAECRIKRKRLIQLVCDVQKDVFIYATVIGVEVLILPLLFLTRCFFFIIPVIINPNGQYVFLLAKLHKTGNVKPE